MGREEGEESLPEICKALEVRAHSGTPGRLYFAESGINPLRHFEWLRV